MPFAMQKLQLAERQVTIDCGIEIEPMNWQSTSGHIHVLARPVVRLHEQVPGNFV